MTYIVKKGDTLTRIAKMHNTTVRELVSLNGIANPNIICVGQVLHIPTKTTSVDTIKLINDCVDDIQKLPSFKKFMEMIIND